MLEKDLVQKLTEMSNAYYEGHQIATDEEYDALESKLRAMNPNSEYFNGVRERTAVFYGQKRKHLYSKIGSIQKIHQLSESKIDTRHTISAKLDGTSMTVYFKNGKVLYALTRGDGYEGFDVTDKYLKISEKYSLNFPKSFTGAIRGEVVLSNESWKVYKKNHSDAAMQRNTGTGLLNRKTCDEDVALLDFVVYNLLATNECVTDSVSELEVLEKMNTGFPVCPYIKVSVPATFEQLESYKKEWEHTYPLDGVVLSRTFGWSFDNEVFSPNIQTEAFKFDAESKESDVIGVEWTLQKSGKYTPVVIVSPVELSGALVRRATGFNAKFIEDNRIDVGAKVDICRSNEVIPYINDVLTPSESFQLPDTCPSCGSKLVWKGVHLVCESDKCPEKERLMVYHFLRVCGGDIKGVGDSIYDIIAKPTLQETLDNLRASNFSSATSHQQKMISQIKSNILNGVSTFSFLKSLNFDGVGDTALKRICDYQEGSWAMNYILCDDPDSELLQIPKVGAAVMSELSLKKNRIRVSELFGTLMIRLINIYIPKKEETQDDTGDFRRYCVTGSLSMPRKAFEQLCLSKGWVMTSISKAEVLVTEDPSSGSSKNKEARRLGKPVVNEETFKKEYLQI